MCALSTLGSQMKGDQLQNAVSVLQNVIVPEPDHAETFAFKTGGASRVSRARAIVLAAVDVDYQAVRQVFM